MLATKLPVKSDVQLLSQRKRARTGCPGPESGVPAGSPDDKGLAVGPPWKGPERAPGHALLTCLKGLWKPKLKFYPDHVVREVEMRVQDGPWGLASPPAQCHEQVSPHQLRRGKQHPCNITGVGGRGPRFWIQLL